ncbi:hypothetical protein FOL47_003143 [Perkinsus chesapeaki]|uniref:Peptidase C1A papain C-terminal domain-containing protein n=1 Tax=Perkinsus chesapeaki TaxID=330153 RepID=A0A7J6MAM0_PERCH|nr:hypothetical protein FOL47_003143 [Perkinsus chesapeaki]
MRHATSLYQDPPTDFSWVTQGAVNPPIDQRDCESCYAIATLGGLEGAFKIRTGSLARFSTQQVVDCSKGLGNRGCYGGGKPNTLRYVFSRGIVSDAAYPYTAKEGEFQEVTKDKNKQCLQAGDLDLGKSIVIDDNQLGRLFTELIHGPIVVSVDADTPQWRRYTGGILADFYCNGEPKHTVLLVGYGVERNTSYWLLRNNRGPKWGEGGYVRIFRDPNAKTGPGFCNIMAKPAFRPVIADKMKATACRDKDS